MRFLCACLFAAAETETQIMKLDEKIKPANLLPTQLSQHGNLDDSGNLRLVFFKKAPLIRTVTYMIDSDIINSLNSRSIFKPIIQKLYISIDNGMLRDGEIPPELDQAFNQLRTFIPVDVAVGELSFN